MEQFSHKKLIVASLLLIHAVLVAYGATRHSPNLNEPGHLVAGLSHWEYQRFELYRVNPPFVRMIATIPVCFMDIKTDWSHFHERPGARPVFKIGSDFVIANGEDAYWIFTVARWACLPFTLLGGYFCYRWAEELYGFLSGILALSCWCFSPNILAHAQCITPDCGASTLGLISGYYFWHWLKGSHLSDAGLAGLTLGFALLSKGTWIILFGLWPLMWGIWLFVDRKSVSILLLRKQFGQLAIILGIGLYILNTGYFFEGSFTRLKEFQFVSQSLKATEIDQGNDGAFSSNKPSNRFTDSWLGEIPVPVPRNYLLGIDIQKRDFEDFGRESYLRGEFRDRGWWYYYLYAMGIKVPLGYGVILILATFQAVLHWKNIESIRNVIVLLVPVVVIFVLVSSQTGFSHHLRYVLLVFPFLFVWMGQSAEWLSHNTKLAGFTLLTGLVWAVASSLYYFPHSLSYFNEIAGGPLNGHNHLINSNIDWGQDLKYLKEWSELHPEARPLFVCYYGTLNYYGQSDIQALGVDAPLPPISEDREFIPPPGWYAISVNYLKGYGWKQPKNGFAYFQKFEPVARAGYSIYIYHVEE
ncbi:hypothetical protein [Gimesia sp.]|uniref:ArnT family glycosyltransferase n=1 Tax=Gimesia sp. TaxID=2024833 RepID=UPI0032F07076